MQPTNLKNFLLYCKRDYVSPIQRKLINYLRTLKVYTDAGSTAMTYHYVFFNWPSYDDGLLNWDIGEPNVE